MPAEQWSSCSTAEADLAAVLRHEVGDQSVRVIEAVASSLVNSWRQGGDLTSNSQPGGGLHEGGSVFEPEDDALSQLCRRIARRALGGSLADLTEGATAFHRANDLPQWAERLMPVAVIGPYLFYRRDPRRQARDKLSETSEIAPA